MHIESINEAIDELTKDFPEWHYKKWIRNLPSSGNYTCQGPVERYGYCNISFSIAREVIITGIAVYQNGLGIEKRAELRNK